MNNNPKTALKVKWKWKLVFKQQRKWTIRWTNVNRKLENNWKVIDDCKMHEKLKDFNAASKGPKNKWQIEIHQQVKF